MGGGRAPRPQYAYGIEFMLYSGHIFTVYSNCAIKSLQQNCTPVYSQVIRKTKLTNISSVYSYTDDNLLMEKKLIQVYEYWSIIFQVLYFVRIRYSTSMSRSSCPAAQSSMPWRAKTAGRRRSYELMRCSPRATIQPGRDMARRRHQLWKDSSVPRSVRRRRTRF